jgi:hypothetical protein
MEAQHVGVVGGDVRGERERVRGRRERRVRERDEP